MVVQASAVLAAKDVDAHSQVLMAQNHKQKISAANPTDAQIAEGIHYLDPECHEISKSEEDDTVLAICASLLFIVAGIVAYVWFCLRIS
jgi:hypothetical protein